MHLPIAEQSYDRTPVYVDTKTKDGTPMAFQGYLTQRINNQCVVEGQDNKWYCVPVEQVFPLQ